MEKLRFVTDENGKQVGVLLDVNEYHRLVEQTTSDYELLIGLSQAELLALAESHLAPAAQSRLDDLLRRNVETGISPEEEAELDHLLEQVDQLNILKTRARYTLKHHPPVLASAA